jgi:hypothetical protein
MKRNGILIFVLSVLFFQQINAQSHFRDGYVLISEKDTLYGKIDNKNYYNNSQFCDFKRANADSVIRFYPDNIYGYRFNRGSYYISKNITIKKKQVRVFAEYLVHGKLDLYLFQDEERINHYFASKDTSSLNELIYRADILDNGGVLTLHESKLYLGVMAYLTSDCETMKDDLKSLDKCESKKLMSFTKKYDLTCADAKSLLYAKNYSRKVKLSVYGGPADIISGGYFDKNDNTIYSNFGFNFLFQATEQSEKLYLGIGFHEYSNFAFLIPFSFNYLDPRMGISPVISYDIDVRTWGTVQFLKPGLKYQMKNSSIFIAGDLMTWHFTDPMAFSLDLGLSFNLN